MSQFNRHDERKVRIRFLETEERIKPQELSNYLFYSKVLYSAIQANEEVARIITRQHRDLENDIDYFEYVVENKDRILENIIPYLSKISYRRRTALFWDENDEYPLEVEDLGKENPIEIIFVGFGGFVIFISALTAAEAEFEINTPVFSGKAGINCKKSLGEGIQDLKDAFQNDDDEEEEEPK